MVLYTISIKKRQNKIDGVVMGVYRGWNSFVLKYGCEVFLEKRKYLLYDQYQLAVEVVAFNQKEFVVTCVRDCVIDIIFKVKEID